MPTHQPVINGLLRYKTTFDQRRHNMNPCTRQTATLRCFMVNLISFPYKALRLVSVKVLRYPRLNLHHIDSP